jgi:beta-mannosidase
MQASVLSEVGATHGTGLSLGAWSCTGRPAHSITHPDQLNDHDGVWLPAIVPGTVAAALDAAGRWDFNTPTDIDASDWWFRTTFAASEATRDGLCWLRCDGLATLAEVWFNGQQVLSGDNMFRCYGVDVAPLLQAENELVIGFRSVSEDLKRKRPRPRWKTNLVRNQQLRWLRTSLIGRIPGWAPCAPTVGPWRSVRLETGPILLEQASLAPALIGGTGVLSVRARIRSRIDLRHATLRVGEAETLLRLHPVADGWGLTGAIELPDAPLWWPHTHGSPRLLPCAVEVEAAGETVRLFDAPIGFRELKVAQTDGEFTIHVNGEPIFCRGACWTVNDLLSPGTDESSLRRDLQLAKDAGANMLRVGGTMQYECDAFYRLCDELGLLVWQDFMFANMDYPVDDSTFHENITAEAVELLTRLAPHPSVAVYCGNSEVEQQAAMLGLPRERWSNDWFGKELPQLCAAHHAGTAYVPSTPTGGALPFHTQTGITHFYGLGAYLRSPGELRQSDVKFTPECLGFANIPEPATVFAVTGGSHPVMHDPIWKRRVPRDGGAGWDFEDVRDHYLRETYGLDPVQLRSFDMPRYLKLSRAVSGEMMARAFSEWRSTHSRNRGALVWFYKDLWPGAGWGVLDSTGLPKAAYYFLKRSWCRHQLTVSDEGLNGLDLHLTNESSEPCAGSIEVMLLKEPNIVVARKETTVELPARSQHRVGVDELLGRFCDVTHAYRFGPPSHDVAIATWLDEERQVVCEAFHFVRRLFAGLAEAESLSAIAQQISHDGYRVTLDCDRFLDTVRLESEGFLPDDNYFHLVPQRPKTVTFRRVSEAPAGFRATVVASNLNSEVFVSVPPTNLQQGSRNA